MPNVKISQLPYIAASFDIQTLMPIVHQGTTYHTTVVDFLDVIAPGGISETSNLTQSIYTDGGSSVKFPSAAAVKTYADGLVTGLLSDRGNYTPGLVSPGAFPSTGGRGPAGIPAKGDLWFVAASGFLGTTAVVAGQSVRALVDAPGQTAGNWDILDVAGFTVPPEDSSNKVANKTGILADPTSAVKYPSVNAMVQMLTSEVKLQTVLNAGHDLTDEINAQGSAAAGSMGVGVHDVNAFGNASCSSNTGNYINGLGSNAANNNNGSDVNAIGRDSASNNTGSFVDAMGFQAAESNSGNNVVALGYSSAQGNSRPNVSAIGYEAGKGNGADNLNAIGRYAGKNNAGQDCNFLGFSAGEDNTGNNVFGAGLNAADTNTGNNVIGIGKLAASQQTGSNVTALGENAGNGQTGDNVNIFGNNAGAVNSFDNVNLFGPSASADGNSQLVWINSLGNNARLDANSLTGSRKITLPDASGTMVLSVNGTTPNPLTGDVTITTSNNLPYLMYAANLTFSSGGITATQLYNTIGDGSGDGVNDIAWSYGFGGWYQAQMSAGPFTTKSAVIPSGYIGNGQYFAITGQRISASQMNLFGIRPSDNAVNATAYVQGVYVEIRIYP